MEEQSTINDLQVSLMRSQEEAQRWRTIATMFYDRHENRRSCSLLASCKECDAYEKAVNGGHP